jgi:hypothetical protein
VTALEKSSVLAGRTTLERHDREQLEFQASYFVDAGAAAVGATTEWFLFIPRNVGINADNYFRNDFYADLTGFVRLDLPTPQLDELANYESGPGPLTALPKLFAELRAGGVAAPAIAVHVKLFGHAFAEAVSSEQAALVERLAALPEDERGRVRYLDDVDLFAERARSALAALRRARQDFLPLRRAAPVADNVLEQTDEYSSLYLDGVLAKLWSSARSLKALFDGSCFAARLHGVLGRHASAECAYRLDQGFLNLDSSSLRRSEYFAYRKALLKKAIHQALYVGTQKLKTDKYVRNATGMVAASLAATWAVAAQLPLRQQGLSTSTQLLIFGLPVIAYVAKDRIKELTREWLTGKLQDFDQDVALSAEALDSAGLAEVKGRLRERMKFTSASAVPQDVASLRASVRTVAGTDVQTEAVLSYRRRLTFERIRARPGQRYGIRQIIRFNLRHFLTRLDEPEQNAPHFSPGEGLFVRAMVPKVYHLNLICRTSSPGQTPQLMRWRLVLNKDGLSRVEPIDG